MAKRKKASDGFYRAKVVYKGKTIDVRSQDDKELEEKIRQKKDEIDSGIMNDGKHITVSEWGDKWLSIKKADVSEPVYKSYKIYLEKYIAPQIGDKHLYDVVPSDCKAIVDADLSKSTSHRQKLRIVMTAMFGAAVRDRLIPSNPVTGLKIKKGESKSRRALTDDEAAALLKACETHYAGLWIKMLYYTGMRPQESAPLTWGCIDKETHEICIKRALKNTGATKTSSGARRVVIPEIYYNELLTQEGEPDEYIFQTTEEKNTERGGHMLTYQTMKRRWKSIVREMDIVLGRAVYRNQLQGELHARPGRRD